MADKQHILRKHYCRVSFLLVLLLGGLSVYSQTVNISGNSANEYSSVLQWRIFDPSDADSVVVAEPGKFAHGDYVMLYVVKGLELDPNNGEMLGFRSNIGNYALFIVDEVKDDTIIFNASSGFLDPRGAGTEAQKKGWVSQLIKIPVYRNAVVDADLTAPAWDSLAGTGGVLALYVQNKLTLNANIVMSGMGFAGADPSADIYGSGCYIDGVNKYKQRNYLSTQMDSAGLKGEGAVRRNYQKTRGNGRMINGGGGGNGKYSGGGGGSNYNGGGKGGGQTTVCGAYESSTAGEGGFGFIGTMYLNDVASAFKNRMWLGGGGGTGTRDPLFPASKGGDGGGIVFIVADTIETIGSHGIYSNGESVLTSVFGAGGGGGGGGAIILEVNGYINPIILSALGGKGGSTNNPAFYTGPGGGGGGGVYWVGKDDPRLLDDQSTFPSGGSNAMGEKGLDGSVARLLAGLSAPLNGLVYNSLPKSLTVCSDTIPPKIDAAEPKGGDGSVPIIRWIQSTDKLTWVDAAGTNNQEDYIFTAPLLNTMHYSRVVKIGALVDSLTTTVTYTVLPKIEGNLIAVDDDLQCEGILPGIKLYPNGLLSGANVNSDTTFQWQKWTKHGDTPVAAENEHNSRDYILPVMADTTYFRRIVKSGVCRSVSDTITIKVLDAIVNNTISSKDTLCNGQSPELLVGGVPGGGDNSNYWFDWEESFTQNSGYSSSNVKTKDLDYTSAAFTADRYFKRIVYSGIDSSCVYTSDTFKIEVLDVIANNLIVSNPIITICQFDILPDGGLAGSNPTGGDASYTYSWQVSKDQATWGDSLVTTNTELFNLSSFPGTDTLYMRRKVVSGKDDVCQDYSNTITIDIVEAISNNILTPRTETYCFGDVLPNEMEASLAVSSDWDLGIEWQYRPVDLAAWSPAPGTNSNRNYNYSQVLTDTLFFRRLVWSRKTDSVCTSMTADSVKIFVQAALKNNSINGGADSIEYMCYGLDSLIHGSPKSGMSGGDGVYNLQWLEKVGAGYPPLTGETGENYSLINFTEDKVYRRIVISGECVDTSEIAPIPVKQLPIASLKLKNQADTSNCENEILLDVSIENYEAGLGYNVTLQYTSIGTGPLTLTANEDSDLITLPHTPEIPSFIPYDSMTFVYQLANVKDGRNCVATELNGIENVKVYRKPDARILSEVFKVCGEVLSIRGSDLNGADYGYWQEIGTPKTVLFGDSLLPLTNMFLDLSSYDTAQVRIGWTVVTPKCQSTADTLYTFYEMPTYTPLLKDTLEFYLDDSISLAEQALLLDATAGKEIWTADNSGAIVTENGDFATNFTYEMEHVYTWTLYNGKFLNGDDVCNAQSADLVLIQHDLKQYNAFSPNNDGYNQLFVIPGLIHADDFTFTLFNSWGTKVFQISKANVAKEVVEIDGELILEYILWDGTLGASNEAAPDGTYYYSLSYSAGGKEYLPKSGYIILRR